MRRSIKSIGKNWSIVGKDRNSYLLLVRESLAFAKFQPILNVTTRSVLLVIYPERCFKRYNNMGKKHKENKKRYIIIQKEKFLSNTFLLSYPNDSISLSSFLILSYITCNYYAFQLILFAILL